MNKKGFTLIELLATIAIMTVIATVLTINVVKMNGKMVFLEQMNVF